MYPKSSFTLSLLLPLLPQHTVPPTNSITQLNPRSTSSFDNRAGRISISFKEDNCCLPVVHSETPVMDRRITYAMLKQKWAVGQKQGALEGLETVIRNASSIGYNSSQADVKSYLKCLLKLGDWKIGLLDPWKPVDNKTRREVRSFN